MRILSAVFFLSLLAGKLKTFEQKLPWQNKGKTFAHVVFLNAKISISCVK